MDDVVQQRRERWRIQMEIVELLGHGALGPTKIMYAANLSWNTCKERIMHLESLGWIAKQQVKTAKDVRPRYEYKLTDLGDKMRITWIKTKTEFAIK